MDHPELTRLRDKSLGLDEQIGRIADEFATRLAAGENPSAREYADRYPELASVLLRVLETARAMAMFPYDGTPADPLNGTNDPRRRLGDFQLLRQLGRGGMGIVFEAEQISLKRRVALKLLPAVNSLDERTLTRFRNETHAAASLDHPHIVPVYFVGVEEGWHFYAMRLVDGWSISQLISRESTEPDTSATTNTCPTLRELADRRGMSIVQWAASVTLQVALGLDHAHLRGVIHRDIKPANLLIDSHGNASIVDFGLAQISDVQTITMSGDLIGTLRYMSPEQFDRSLTVDHRTDIYSLGITLHELLVGHLPNWCAASEPPRTGSSKNMRPRGNSLRVIPRDLETIIQTATARESGDRYPTARHLADDLKRFLAGQPVLARRPSMLQRVTRWCRNHQGSVLAALSVAILLTVIGWISALYVLKAQFDTNKALQESIAQRRTAQLQAAHLAADRGLTYCEQGEPARGLHYFSRALTMCPDGEDDLRWWIGANLVSWSSDWPTLQHRLPVGQAIGHLVYCAPRQSMLVLPRQGGMFEVRTPESTSVTPILDAGSIRSVTCLAVDENEQLLALAFPDGTIQCLSLESLGPIGPGKQHPGVLAMAFGQRGETLVTGGYDGRLKVWHVTSGDQPARDYRMPQGIVSITNAPTPNTLVFGDLVGNLFSVDWQLDTSPALLDLHVGNAIHQVWFLPGQTQIGFSAFDALSTASWPPSRTFVAQRAHSRNFSVSRHSRRPSVVSWSDDRFVKSWAQSDLAHEATLDLGVVPDSCLVLPDGRLAVGTRRGADSEVLVYAAPSRSTRRISTPGTHKPGPLAVTPDGRRVLFGDGHNVRDIDTTNGTLGSVNDIGDSNVDRLDVSRDGKLVAIGREVHHLAICDIRSGQRIYQTEQFFGGRGILRFTPDGKSLALYSPHGIRLLDLQTLTFQPITLACAGIPHALEFHPTRSLCATAGSSGVLQVWNTESGELALPNLQHEAPIADVRFTSRGTQLVTTTRTGIVTHWDLATGKQLKTRKLPSDYSECIFASTEQLVVGVSTLGRARFFDTETLRPVGNWFPHDGTTECFAFDVPASRLLNTPDRACIAYRDMPRPVVTVPRDTTSWIDSITGTQLDDEGYLSLLAASDWRPSRARLIPQGAQRIHRKSSREALSNRD